MSTNQIVPAEPDDESIGSSPGQDADSHSAAGRGAGRRRADPGPLPSRDDCLRRLNQLPGLVAMKVITPAQANAIINAYRTILGDLGRTQGGGEGVFNDEQVLALLRSQPELLAVLEPLFTQEQIDLIMSRYAKDNQDAQSDT